MREILFYLIIFATNVIQGITGFAGTILAMPPSLMLVGYDTAKPILNLLGLLAGIYVFVGNRKKVQWQEVKKVILFMLPGILLGIFLQEVFVQHTKLLTTLLGIFVVVLAVVGLAGLWKSVMKKREKNPQGRGRGSVFGETLLLLMAGVVHGVFVSGGPLLIGYLTRKIQEKESFRATISTVWIVLNGAILIGDIRSGYWDGVLLQKQVLALPFFLGGMWCGGKLCKRMSQQAFLVLTYVLLLIAGGTILLK